MNDARNALLPPTGERQNNPTGMFDGSGRRAIDAFRAVLDRVRLPTTVRLTQGRDIAAACGHLAVSA